MRQKAHERSLIHRSFLAVPCPGADVSRPFIDFLTIHRMVKIAFGNRQ